MIEELDVECQAMFVGGVDSDFFELLYCLWLERQKPFVVIYCQFLSLTIIADTCSISRHIVQLYTEHRDDDNAELTAADAISASMP